MSLPTNMARVLTALILALIPLAFIGLLFHYFGSSASIIVTVILLTIPVVVKKRWHYWIYILYKTLPRDITGGIRFARLQLTLRRWRANNATIPKIFLENASRNPHRLCYMHNANTWTLSQLSTFSARIAAFLHQRKLHKGDVVCLLMDGRPEYVGIWLGVARLGSVTALINTTLRGDILLQSIRTAKSVALIYGDEHAQAVKEIRDKLPHDYKLYQFDVKNVDKDGAKSIEAVEVNVLVDGVEVMSKGLMEACTDAIPEYENLLMSISDPLLYIYTSGTTGLPKAAVLTHARFCLMVSAVKIMTPLRDEDVLYCPLPLYHTAGGILGMGQPLLGGCAVAIRTKFSVSGFWTDCQKYGCTVTQYIGEMCRYLLSALPNPAEKNHRVDLFIGNGLQPNLWKTFQDRFHIKNIVEFYGSTEGNANLVNFEGIPGAVGFVPRYAQSVYPVALVACHPETGVEYRNAQGYCISCSPGQAGLLLGKIGKAAHSQFRGYTDSDSTNKKILVNVFKKGDRYFNTGDVLESDEFGYLYFRDRTGDTFRWRGENVSTGEIELVLSGNGAKEVAVYGVLVPGQEGRCGMVAIADPNDTLDLRALTATAKRSLPVHARPLFIRVAPALPLTSTFKVRKVDLRTDGYDLSKMGKKDRLYFYDKKLEEFVPLTEDIHQAILQEKLRL